MAERLLEVLRTRGGAANWVADTTLPPAHVTKLSVVAAEARPTTTRARAM